MASAQSRANRNHYEAAAAAMAAGTPMTREENDRRWAALAAEPEGLTSLEVESGSAKALWLIPDGAADAPVILYCHGGGFVGGSIETHRKMVGHLARSAGCRALLVGYPLADEARFPVQIEVVFGAYRWLLDEGVQAEDIAVAADSAGAILAFGVVQRARATGLPLPTAMLILSGWLDLTVSAPSFATNREKDPLFAQSTVQWLAANVLGDLDPRDPLASPLYADLTGFPPIYLQAGADETLVDESRMLAERARSAGVEVRLDVFPEMLHSFQMMAGNAPEADAAIAQLAAWVRPKLRRSTLDAGAHR